MKIHTIIRNNNHHHVFVLFTGDDGIRQKLHINCNEYCSDEQVEKNLNNIYPLLKKKLKKVDIKTLTEYVKKDSKSIFYKGSLSLK